jgi:glycerophosphoryl diester phosphodiesterase
VKHWIFAHRGEWNDAAAPNSASGIRKALANGFGVETDIRDFQGEIVISHDPCVGSNFDEFCDFLGDESRFAINIKSDGLATKLQHYSDAILQSSSFVFDCSFPELLRYKQAGIPHAMRFSEYEKEMPWKPDFIWLDAFESDWWLEDANLLKTFESIPTVIVSPELHKRDHIKVWERVIELRSGGLDISICTDFPNELAALAGVK